MNPHGIIAFWHRGLLIILSLVLGSSLLFAGCATTQGVGGEDEVIDFNEIEKEGRGILQANPGNGFGHEVLGFALWKQGRYAEAEQEYREVIRLLPGDPLGYGRLGVILADQGKFEEAEKQAQQGVQLRPNDSYAMFYLACCYALWGKKDKAIKALQTADEKGAINWPEMKHCTELRGIREDSRVKEIAERVKERWSKLPKPPRGI